MFTVTALFKNGGTIQFDSKDLKELAKVVGELNRAFYSLGEHLQASAEGAAKAFQALRDYLPEETNKG